MPSCSLVTERIKPLLGTFVSVRVGGLAADRANDLLNRCFSEVATIHRLMSFQEEGSDVSRLNREAHLRPVQVDFRTYEVLSHAASVSMHSEGAFDVTVAPHLASAQSERRPRGTRLPDPAARWSDVVLLPDNFVGFACPLWVDLSGIAKGHAVDEVMKIVSTAAPYKACVNAGGDLAVFGPDPESVWLDLCLDDEVVVPVVELRNGCMASSGARRAVSGEHIDGASRHSSPSRFVSVLASSCVVADALTKVVMAQGAAARIALRHFAASAIMSVGVDGWLELS